MTAPAPSTVRTAEPRRIASGSGVPHSAGAGAGHVR